MRVFLLGLILITTQSLGNELKELLKEELALEQQVLEWALPVAQAESGIRQLNSKSGNDIGIFQFTLETIAERGLDRKRLETEPLYQLEVYKEFMAVKYFECRKQYPKSWPACWNSARKKQHYIYWEKLKRAKAYLENKEEVQSESKSN